jgi:hypothetical protein
MGLKDRLDRLEGDGGFGEACEECGSTPGERTVFSLEEDSDGEASRELPEYCPACGQIIRFTLDIGDAPVRSWPEEADAEGR